jgi:GTP-binding protein
MPERSEQVMPIEPAAAEERRWQIERLSQHHFRVSGIKIERLLKMTDFANEEAAGRFQRVLAASGISGALEKAGVAAGDIVHIAGAELIWDEVALVEPSVGDR